MKRERGAVYVVTLAILAGMVVLMSALATNNREDVKAISNRTQKGRAELMAQSALQRAIAEIQQQTGAQSKLSDDWASLGSAGSIQYNLGNDSFRIQITDACAQVSINAAAEPQLKRLPMTAEQVASLQDWREAKTDERPSGAKDSYYGTLGKPYKTKLQPFDSVPELLLVRGFTPESLYSRSGHPAALDTANTAEYDGPLADLLTTDSQSEDKNPTAQPKVDIRSATADQLVAVGVPSALAAAILQQQGSFQKLGDVFSVPNMTTLAAQAIANNFTIGAPTARTALINLNTAPEAVIASVPGLTPDIAQAIVDRQSTSFQGLGDLLDVPGMNLSLFGQFVDNFCVSSRAFVVRVIGTAGRVSVALETTMVQGDDGQVRMTRLQPRSLWEARDRWNWPANPTSIVDAEGGR